MARLSELPRRAPPKRQWKPWLWPLLLLGTGFVLGHYFHHENDEKEGVPSALVDSGMKESSLGPSSPTQNDNSAIASARFFTDSELAHSEPSAIATSSAPLYAINLGQRSPPTPSQSLKTDSARPAAAPNYAALRRELLRHLH